MSSNDNTGISAASSGSITANVTALNATSSSWITAFLSQRDASLAVPVNFVTQPGITLSAACFANGVYDTAQASTCMTNLLQAGFRKYTLDVYWDSSRGVWGFCPVQADSTAVSSKSQRAILARSESSLTPSVSSTSSVTGTSTASVSASATATSAPAPNGHYTCSPDLTLSTIVAAFTEYVQGTSTTLNAYLHFIVMNLHNAAPSPGTTAPALNSSTAPSSGSFLSDIINTNLSNFAYTPTILLDDRSNLNTSWLHVDLQDQTDLSYMTITKLPDNTFTTPDGWPGLGYIELARAHRGLFGFGTIDSQMQSYNFAADEATIFPPGYMTSVDKGAAIGSNGRVTGGCFVSPDSLAVSTSNSSWAITTDLSIQDPSINSTAQAIGNVTACGISPVFSTNGMNVTADQNATMFHALAEASIWSWYPGEPRNSTTNDPFYAGQDVDVSASNFRCAAFDGNTGHWRVADCSERHAGACRNGKDPLQWSIGRAHDIYGNMDSYCPDGSLFSVTRNSMENSYLLQAWHNYTTSGGNSGNSDTLLWLNFNSLDVQGCWVAGINSTCPYSNSNSTDSERTQVAVPTVAGVIVLFLATLTVFVKCAANRRNKRRRRRRRGRKDMNEWEFEGVPA